MPTIPEMKAELKALGVKGITGKNKAELMAMLEQAKAPKVAPKAIPLKDILKKRKPEIGDLSEPPKEEPKKKPEIGNDGLAELLGIIAKAVAGPALTTMKIINKGKKSQGEKKPSKEEIEDFVKSELVRIDQMRKAKKEAEKLMPKETSLEKHNRIAEMLQKEEAERRQKVKVLKKATPPPIIPSVPRRKTDEEWHKEEVAEALPEIKRIVGDKPLMKLSKTDLIKIVKLGHHKIGRFNLPKIYQDWYDSTGTSVYSKMTGAKKEDIVKHIQSLPSFTRNVFPKLS